VSRIAAEVLTAPIVKPKSSRDDWTMRAFMGVIGIYLIVALALPLYAMLSKSLEDHDGVFIGFANFIEYFSTPALAYSINNSLFIAVITTIITVTLAFTFAYALTRSCAAVSRSRGCSRASP
jgi:iron(III) transport system permease protein